MDGFSLRDDSVGSSVGTIDLQKVPAEDNCADIVTKCLTGAAFDKHRATILGLQPRGQEKGEK